MKGYWIRQRLLPTVVLSVAVALIAGLLFVFPHINQQATRYNDQSVYKNSNVDFIAPEPSNAQVDELAGKNGIDKVFPFYLTKTSVTVNGKSRTTTVLLSDRFQDASITMYSDKRLIEKSNQEFDNPVLADWQFCKDTSSKLGDTISVTIGGQNISYTISGVYETNSIYDDGAILVGISASQKETIMQNSMNSGYSAMYVKASDYNACRAFLTTEYRPLGRLKDKSQFESESQYQVHYDAIMNSSYANEITDFRVRENAFAGDSNPLMVCLGAVLCIALMLAFNILMAKRGSEAGYFRKHCIPKGQNVKPYYKTSFAMEVILTIALYAAVLVWRYMSAEIFIPKAAIDWTVIVIPVAIVVAAMACLAINNSMVNELTRIVKAELAKKKHENGNDLNDGAEEGED